MKAITSIPTYRNGEGRTVQFIRVEIATRQWAYRVTIDGRAVDWMQPNFAPSLKTAAFFLEKHT
jgi:hypothetical protein